MESIVEQALNPRRFPLFAVRGIPGSGKSTFAEKLKNAIERKSALVSGPYTNVECFENDEFFIDLETGEYRFDRELCPIAAEWTIGRVAHTLHLKKNTPCIVANTFTTFNEIRPYMNLAGYFRKWLVVFRMENDFPNVHNVPADVIDQMKKRLAGAPFKGEIIVNKDNCDQIVNEVAEWVVKHSLK